MHQSVHLSMMVAAVGRAVSGEGRLEVRVPSDELAGGGGQAVHGFREQELYGDQKDEDRPADDQADGRLAFRAAPAAAGGPAQLLGAAALGVG